MHWDYARKALLRYAFLVRLFYLEDEEYRAAEGSVRHEPQQLLLWPLQTRLLQDSSQEGSSEPS